MGICKTLLMEPFLRCIVHVHENEKIGLSFSSPCSLSIDTVLRPWNVGVASSTLQHSPFRSNDEKDGILQ